MSLFDLIFDFYAMHVFSGEVIESRFADVNWDVGTYNMAFGEYLCATSSIITIIFILVACVMFVVKIIKLVGNLVK